MFPIVERIIKFGERFFRGYRFLRFIRIGSTNRNIIVTTPKNTELDINHPRFSSSSVESIWVF